MVVITIASKPDGMKRLLLLPFLCLIPAAQAMDYVKCEAMQKAQSRIQNSIRQNKSEREDALDYAAELAHMKCGSPRGSGDDEPPAEWKACVLPILKKHEVPLVNKELEQLENRAAQVQDDYDAEGCY